MTCKELHHHTLRRLRAAGIDNAEQEARWICEHSFANFATRILTVPDEVADSANARRVEQAVERRSAGEPLQYILGSTEFYSLELETASGVLIPRPETEWLVDLVLRTSHPPGPVLDLCCGSGAIALALAANFAPPRRIVAADSSSAAVSTTKRNAQRLGLSVEVRQGDLFDPASERFAVIVTNPPYVSESEYAELDPEVRDHEPPEALRAGNDGLDVIRRIAEQAADHLLSGADLFCEIGARQGEAVKKLFETRGFVDVHILPDHAGRDRIVQAQNAGD